MASFTFMFTDSAYANPELIVILLPLTLQLILDDVNPSTFKLHDLSISRSLLILTSSGNVITK